MKQAQFRRSAQSGGFRPIQVSGAEISRMREESNRIIQGMRDARDADIQNRQQILQEVKENQRSEAAARERNYQIQQQNQQTKLSGLQAEARAQQEQFRIDQQAQADIFKNVAEFSKTATEAYGQYVKAKDEEIVSEEFRKAVLNPENNSYINYISSVGEAYQDEEEEKRQSALDEAELKGGDSLGISKQRNLNNRQQRELNKALFTWTAKYRLPQLQIEAVQRAEEQFGRRLTSEERAGVIQELTQEFFRKGFEFNGVKLKPGTLRTTIDLVTESNQAFLARERGIDEKAERQRSIDNETKIITQNPAEFATNIVPAFQTVYRANGFDYAKAHDWFGGLATMRNPNGEFIFTLDQLANVQLPSDKKPYALARPGRFSEIQQARLEADNSYRRTQITSDNLAYQQAEQNYLKGFVENPTKAYAEEARDMFMNTYGRVPASVEKSLASYTIEAKAKAEQIEKLESIPDGFITQEAVNALSYLDINSARELDKRFAAQEAKYNSGVFKDQSDSFKTVANGVTSFGSQKPNDPASVFLQQEMRAEYRKRVDQAVAGGADFNTAANTIAQQLADEVKTGAKDPNSLWYRKASKPGGAADFPRLTGGNVTTVEKARRNYQAIVTSVKEKGLEGTLDTAESILTRDEIVSIVSGYGKPGFVVPTDVLAVTGMGNGLDPFTVINRQIEALGDPELQPLEPPAIINSVNSTMTEQQRQDLFNAVNGPKQRLRALHSSVGTQLNYRAGLPVASATATKPTPREVYDYMRELGVSDTHAKGILANIEGESRFQPDVMGDNGMSGGLFQMYNDRYRKMELSVPDWRTNWKGQVRHALQDDSAPQYLQMQFNSPEEAADWFLENYERPAMEHRPGRRRLNRSFIPNLGF